jgi:hypothetical protein
MIHLLAFLRLAASSIMAYPGWYLGAWSVVAAFVNRVLWHKRPDMSKAEALFHFLLIDWIAFLPSKGADGKGISFSILGVPVSVPLLSWSQILAGPNAGQSAPSGKERGSMSFALMLLLASIVMLACAVLSAGCATAQVDAKKTVGGMYAACGIVSTMQKACDAVAIARAENGDLHGGLEIFEKCGKIGQARKSALDAADAADKAIDAAADLGSKDFSGALSPMLQSGCKLNDAVRDWDPNAPVVIPCGGN